jgi:hypothetical protein
LLDEALAAPDHPWIANNVRVLEQTRANARKNIGEVAVVGGPAGAELLVNGIPVGRLPLAQPIRLDRGQVELQLRAAGYAPLSRSLRIAGGARERLSMTLERVPGGPGVETAPPPAAATAPPVTRPPGDSATTVAGPQPLSADGGDAAPAAPAATAGTDGAAATGGIAGTPPTPADSETGGGGSRLLRPMAWTAAVGAAAGLTLGVVETIVATNRIDEFNHHTAPSPTADDPDRRVLDCATAQLSDTCRSIRNAHDRARVLAIVGYVAGGALAATSAVLFVLSSRRSPGVDTARAAVACAPELPGPGLACRFSF